MSFEDVNKNKFSQRKEGKVNSFSKRRFKSLRPSSSNKEANIASSSPSKKVKTSSFENKNKESFSNKKPKNVRWSSQRPVVSVGSSLREQKSESKPFARKFHQSKIDSQQKRRFMPRKKVKFFIPPFERRKFTINLICNLCNKIIDDPLSAFASPNDSEKGCHFECVLKKIRSEVSLKKGESLVYAGSGCFAIVSIIQGNRKYQKVSIRDKIEFENHRKDQIISWRKELIQR